MGIRQWASKGLLDLLNLFMYLLFLNQRLTRGIVSAAEPQDADSSRVESQEQEVDSHARRHSCGQGCGLHRHMVSHCLADLHPRNHGQQRC